MSVEVDLHAAHRYRRARCIGGSRWYSSRAPVTVTVTTDSRRPGAIERIQHPERAIARPPTIVLTDAGVLRFVEPLDCPTDEMIERRTGIEIETQPNLATFVVGVVATSRRRDPRRARRAQRRRPTIPSLYAGVARPRRRPAARDRPVDRHRTERCSAGPEAPPVRQPRPERAVRRARARREVRDARGSRRRGPRRDRSRRRVLGVAVPARRRVRHHSRIPAWDVSAVVDADAGPREDRGR